MAWFRKKPVAFEAEQFRPDQPLPFNDRGPYVAFDGTQFYVTTVHGQKVFLETGDWVIIEPRGRYAAYPCKPDIFEEFNEPATAVAKALLNRPVTGS